MRFPSHSSGRDSKSLTLLKSKDCNREKGKQDEDDVDVVADVDAIYLAPFFLVCCKFNTFELTFHNLSASLRYGNRGMKVRLGHH